LKTTDWDIVVIDSLSYAGDVERLTDVEGLDWSRVRVLYHDLRAPLHNHPIAARIGAVDHVVNMAAGSHVDTSIKTPASFFRNNVDVAVNMLEFARHCAPDAKFIQVSTDEVYGPAPAGVSHVEWDPIKPSNPYAGSKAAQEAAAFSWWRTYGLRLAITNTMNNFGERQHPEKFVPMAIRKLLTGEPVPLHGRPIQQYRFDGVNVPQPSDDPRWQASSRVWLHARNHADALRFLIEDVDFPVYSPEHSTPVRFNVAGEREIGVDVIVTMIADAIKSHGRDVPGPRLMEWVDFHSSRPGHDLRYSLDGSALAKAGWTPPVSIKDSFEKTVHWYLDRPEWLGL
jgi:dTDP-glucose 4,6-dehydratase